MPNRRWLHKGNIQKRGRNNDFTYALADAPMYWIVDLWHSPVVYHVFWKTGDATIPPEHITFRACCCPFSHHFSRAVSVWKQARSLSKQHSLARGDTCSAYCLANQERSFDYRWGHGRIVGATSVYQINLGCKNTENKGLVVLHM